MGAGTVAMSVRLPAGRTGPAVACVDGRPAPVRLRGGMASWRMRLRAGRASRWAVVAGTQGAGPACGA